MVPNNRYSSRDRFAYKKVVEPAKIAIAPDLYQLLIGVGNSQ